MGMNTYRTIDEMWIGALRDAQDLGSNQGSRNGTSREVIGWSGRLTDPGLNFLANARRKLSAEYAAAELLWYLSGKDTLEAVTPYAPSYDKFAEPDGRAYGAYGYRLKHNVSNDKCMLSMALDAMDRHPESRQIVVSLWRPDDLEHAVNVDKKDLPCTLSWQFLVRDDRLHMVTNMRSNDIWLGMPYDIFVNTCIQRLLADTKGLLLGTYTHNVGSLHLYAKDHDKAAEALKSSEQRETLAHGWRLDLLDDAGSACALESEMREGAITTYGRLAEQCDGLSLEGLLRDMVACVSGRWLTRPMYPTSNALRAGLKSRVQ